MIFERKASFSVLPSMVMLVDQLRGWSAIYLSNWTAVLRRMIILKFENKDATVARSIDANS